MDVQPVPATTDAALPVLVPAEVPSVAVVTPMVPAAASPATPLEALCAAVLSARPFLQRPPAPTDDEERAWRERVSWRVG